MIHVGFNFYLWGGSEQRRLLADWLAPLHRQLTEEGLARRLFFSLFDARGPHLFVLLSTGEGRAEELEERLSAELARRLEDVPSYEVLEPETLEELHRQCRGGQMCAADGLPGIAANNSFVLFRQPPEGYPFEYTAGLSWAPEVWEAMDHVARWALEKLAAGSAAAATVRWMAAVDGALREHGADAADFWRFYATTLLLPLADRLREDEEAVLSSLPGWVGEANRASFSRLWDNREATLTVPAAAAVARWIVEDTPQDRRWTVLRHLCHIVRGQLAVPVRLEIPMVLFAWQHNLSSLTTA